MNDFLYNLLIGAAVALTSFTAKKLWKFVSSGSASTYPKIDIKRVRKQFFICLILLIGAFIAFATFSNSLVKTGSAVLIFFSFIFVWGAFDALYFALEELDNNSGQQVSDKTSTDN